MFPAILRPKPRLKYSPGLMTYQELLRHQLNRRIQMNPRYSLRAFANYLDLQASKLSEILNGKRASVLRKPSKSRQS